MQIGDELETHTGLLEELDHELDHTHGRLGSARRRLGRVARGAKENGASFRSLLFPVQYGVTSCWAVWNNMRTLTTSRPSSSYSYAAGSTVTIMLLILVLLVLIIVFKT